MLTLLSDLTVPAAVSLGLIPVGALVFVLAFADANLAYFDPRRADESDRAVPVLLVVGPVLAVCREFAAGARRYAVLSLREAALTVAALLILTIPTGDPR